MSNDAVENVTVSKTLKDSDIINIKSLVPNVHYTCSKTGDYFYWANVGDIQEMTFAQLKVMKNRHIGYFTKKWLYPIDEIALKKLGIKELLVSKFERKDISLLYGTDVDAVKEKITNISDDYKEELITKVIADVKSGKIANVKIIRMLEKELGIELMNLV